jgi:surface-anchored protein
LVVYETDDFGVPTMLLSSQDGITGADSLLVPAGEHRHVNWAFTEPGDYTVTFNASGMRQSDGQFTTSGDVDYLFRVEAVPEPGMTALFGLGALCMVFLRRR